ncbi:hypothetical protein ACOME3_004747 [Neoechinorhynchus agilis]
MKILVRFCRNLSSKPRFKKREIVVPPFRQLENAGKIPLSPNSSTMDLRSVEACLQKLSTLPRITLHNLSNLPESAILRKRRLLPCRLRPQYEASLLSSKSKKAVKPFYLDVPNEPYYEGFEDARQYTPISLLQLQRLIDLGKLKTDQLIDMAAICNTRIFRVPVEEGYFGFNLTDEGSNAFAARGINIEVQNVSSETVIAAIEQLGGRITCRYYDIESLNVLSSNSAYKIGLIQQNLFLNSILTKLVFLTLIV